MRAGSDRAAQSNFEHPFPLAMQRTNDFETNESPGNITEMAFLVVENEKLRRKLRKSQDRRDYYARMYYHLLADMDAMRYELEHARRKIHFFQSLSTQFPRAQTSFQPHPNPGNLSMPQWADSRSSDSGTCLSPTDHSLATLLATDLRTSDNIGEDVKTQQPKTPLQLQPRNTDASSKHLHSRKKAFYSQDDASIQSSHRSELYLSQPGPCQAHYALPRPTFTGGQQASLSQSFPSPPRPPHRPRERSRAVSQLVSTHGGVRHNTRPTNGAFRNDAEPEQERFLHSQDVSSRASAFKPVSLKGMQKTRGAEVRAGPGTTEETSQELGKTSECRYDALNGVELLDLLSRISDPNCGISKLEVSNTELGRPEAMKLFCRDLLKNRSITELSLPNNKICEPSLKILLDSVLQCENIKELMLRNNLIGKDSIGNIKSFLERTTLDSLVLTGNEIEQYSDLLGQSEEFTLEYNTPGGSEDSGNITENDHRDSLQRMQYLHI
eukprot:Em0016g42a